MRRRAEAGSPARGTCLTIMPRFDSRCIQLWFQRATLALFAFVLASSCRDLTRPRLEPNAKAVHDDCNTMFEDCGDPIYAPVSPPAGLQVGYDWNGCVAPTIDADLDGVDDNCEFALARAFAPLLKVDGGDCDWDSGLNRLGGEYYFAVQRNDELGPRIRIAYMPGYYKDCGAGGHLGDSEFILEDVSYALNSAGGAWQLRGVFTSAHCGEEFGGISVDPNCQWWDASQFHLNGDPSFGYPSIWISKGKHGNYQSYGACNDAYAGFIDTCSGSPLDRRFPVVYSWQNIGSAKKPDAGLNLPPRWGSSLIPASGTSESFWAPFWWFKGWNPRNSNTDGVTPYGMILAGYAHFWSPTVVPYQCEQNIYYPVGC